MLHYKLAQKKALRHPHPPSPSPSNPQSFSISLTNTPPGGRSNALPGFLVWGLLGLSGQYAYNYADAAHTSNVLASQTAEPQPSLTDKLFRSKWNPIKKLTDVEYEGMLEAKLLAVNAELAITNEQIAELEVQQRKMVEEKREEKK
jgi:hypothetical protein